MSRRRFPASVYGTGEEPDPRFSLANERTYLAWIRTSMALIALGVGLEAFGLDLNATFRLPAAVMLIVAGSLLPLQSFVGWARVERSLRSAQPLPNSIMTLPIAALVLAAGVLITLGALIQ